MNQTEPGELVAKNLPIIEGFQKQNGAIKKRIFDYSFDTHS